MGHLGLFKPQHNIGTWSPKIQGLGEEKSSSALKGAAAPW